MQTNKSAKPNMKKGEEKGFRASFLRVFGKYDLRNERQFVFFCKWLIFIVIVLVVGFIFTQHCMEFEARGGWTAFFWLVAVSGTLVLAEGLKLFIVKGRARVVLYILDALSACGFTFVTDGTAAMLVYMLVLTEFYIGAERTRPSAILFSVSVPLYVASYLLQNYVLFKWNAELFPLLTQLISAVFALLVHFILVQVGVAFYRQFVRLDTALKELDASKKELEKAYTVVAEVTALEERQRIAKDIHDTAGHSITTVIMQTESAKLLISSNPEEAKNKIVAANLQAKHALEELRDSVHLLSGVHENQTLKTALEGIIHESTDGTGITIRSEIEEISVSPTKFRFLCNSLKEGISNGLRHGGATAFWFELKEEEGKIRFFLSDNGKGVELNKLKIGFGLSGMHDRAKSLGGEVEFVSAADDGFELKITLPVDMEK